MTELLTAAQMRAIEAAAIASGQVTGLELMERAGRGVVEAVFAEWPELAAGSHRAVVLCGPGGNGGDGFVVARLLKEWGWEVEVFLYGDPERMPPDARVNYERWVGMGEVEPACLKEENGAWPYLTTMQNADVIIDALFGTGLKRPIVKLPASQEIIHTGFIDGVWWGGEGCRPWVVAVDMPSGICSDSGRAVVDRADMTDSHLAAHLTVTFHRAKLGHHLAHGPKHMGRLVVADIGLEARVPDHRDSWPENLPYEEGVELVCAPKVLSGWSDDVSLSKSFGAHKYSHGHALILCGGVGHGGAARLAARGALRVGAGVVTVGCPPAAVIENAARLDAVMLRRVGDAGALAEVLEDKRITALCLGPGMGTGPREAAVLAVALGGPPPTVALDGPPPPSPPHEGEGGHPDDAAGPVGEALPLPLVGRGQGRGAALRPTVLDADALTLLSRNPALFAMLHGGCVLTPHAGEFARLFPDIAAKLAEPAVRGPAYSKVDATRDAAARAGCVVLFKGADTVIADPSGRCSINSAAYERAAPWLATAGSGDVLAGFITGLLARGFYPMHAAETAAWLHVECARRFGPGLIAEDLPEELPKVFRALGL